MRWFNEGVTYEEMQQRYRDKYNIETTLSMWGNFRRRKGLPRRITRDDDLIPWMVKPQHRHSYPILMLRKEARRRSGAPVTEEQSREIDGWLRNLKEDGAVVHYDPDTEQGWFYVKRRPDIDTDIIRRPVRKTTPRRAAD